MPVRNAPPWIARLFQKHNFVIQGPTKKAAYASGFAGEPLLPVQAVTSAIFATSGIVGVALFLGGYYRLAAILPLFCVPGSGCNPARLGPSSRLPADRLRTLDSKAAVVVDRALLLLRPQPRHRLDALVPRGCGTDLIDPSDTKSVV
jgi:hypothetical protein